MKLITAGSLLTILPSKLGNKPGLSLTTNAIDFLKYQTSNPSDTFDINSLPLSTSCKNVFNEQMKKLETSTACGASSSINGTNVTPSLINITVADLNKNLDEGCNQKCADEFANTAKAIGDGCRQDFGNVDFAGMLKASYKLTCLKNDGKYCLVDQLEKMKEAKGENYTMTAMEFTVPENTNLCGPCIKGQVQYSEEMIDAMKIPSNSADLAKSTFTGLKSKCPPNTVSDGSKLTTTSDAVKTMGTLSVSGIITFAILFL